jgi:hypothetical protein
LWIGTCFWFAVVGWVTVVMTGGIRRRPRQPKPKRPPAPPAEDPKDFADVFSEPAPDAEHDLLLADDEAFMLAEPTLAEPMPGEPAFDEPTPDEPTPDEPAPDERATERDSGD